jgi:hypothetical protein
MTKDILESTVFAVITALFLGLLWAALVFTVWILVCKTLRTKELDSDYEHTNHPRHRGLYH